MPCYRGVHIKDGWWQAVLTHKGRCYDLGSHDTEEAAARAYDQAALQLRGAKADLNYPSSGWSSWLLLAWEPWQLAVIWYMLTGVGNYRSSTKMLTAADR